jgi:hypothetical protein
MALLFFNGINACLPRVVLLFSTSTHYTTIAHIAHDRAATGIGFHSDYVSIYGKIFRWQFGSRTTETWQRLDFLNPWPMNAGIMDMCDPKAR